jgi:DNA polymerase III epsilon subunit-like protein
LHKRDAVRLAKAFQELRRLAERHNDTAEQLAICVGTSEDIVMKLVAIDFETANQSADSACAIGIVSIEKGNITQKEFQLIRPPQQHFTFSYIHGITWADVQGQASFIEVWNHLISFWKDADYFLAHNASFDRKVMTSCCSASGRSPPTVPFICTVKVARWHWTWQTCQPYALNWEYRLNIMMLLQMHWRAH